MCEDGGSEEERNELMPVFDFHTVVAVIIKGVGGTKKQSLIIVISKKKKLDQDNNCPVPTVYRSFSLSLKSSKPFHHTLHLIPIHP